MTVQAGRLMRTSSWYGLRGVRLGEASNPGPLSKRRRVLRSRALQQSWAGESSDEETLRVTQLDSPVRFDGGAKAHAGGP